MWEETGWDEKSWDEVRRAHMIWEMKCRVRSASVKCKCEVWRVQCEVWRKCLLGVALRRGRAQVMFLDNIWATASHKEPTKVWSVECEVWSVKCVVWRVQWEVRSAKWSFKCDMWNTTQLSQSACTHGLGWHTAHASSIDEKGLIYIYISLRQLPPRLVRVLLVYVYMYDTIQHTICVQHTYTTLFTASSCL